MRLFLAIPLPDEFQHQLGRLMGALREVRGAYGSFPKPTNLHITTLFLGEVPEASLESLKQALTTALSTEPAVPDLLIEQLGAFPSLRNPRQIWTGGIPSQELAGLVERIRAACAAIGLPGDSKPFAPHITLMRVKEVSDSKAWHLGIQRLNFTPRSIPIREIVLFRSTLNARGAEYTPLQSWRIGASR